MCFTNPYIIFLLSKIKGMRVSEDTTKIIAWPDTKPVYVHIYKYNAWSMSVYILLYLPQA